MRPLFYRRKEGKSMVYRKENGVIVPYANNSGQNVAADINIIDKNGKVVSAGGTTNIQALVSKISDDTVELSSDLTDIVKTVSSSTINLGALSSGSAGYGSTTVTIPTGYKTVGIANASKNHPGVGTAFNVMAFLQADVTGQATVDYTYSAVGAVAANAADFHIRILCVRA